ncbi:Uncharacterised protein [Mycobacteroides abscessus subsp. abscessus]|nr:Uncharacterised protein [Mycobacteroides abscessus subsp. abscessus]
MMSVSIGPGAIAFTVTPFGPSSRARPRVRPITPAFATVYGVLLNVPPPRCAETEDRLTMRPYPFRTIDSAARRLAKCTPSRLIDSTRCHSPSGRSR